MLFSFVETKTGKTFYSPNESINSIKDINIIEWCAQYLTDDGIFIDIGSHFGEYPIILSKNCYKVYSFEPHPSNYDAIGSSIVANTIGNITINKSAVSDSIGTRSLKILSDENSSLNEYFKVDQTIDVPVITIDSLNLNNIDFIKIDAVGEELNIFKGASKTLMNNKFPPVLFKVLPDEWFKFEKELLMSFIGNMGYRIVPVMGSDNMFLACDHFMFPKRVSKSEVDFKKAIADYEAGTYQTDDWYKWYLLANHYRLNSKYQSAYDCAHKGLPLASEQDRWRLEEEISIVSYYLTKIDEGYENCERVILANNDLIPWHTRNLAQNNQSFYMSKLSGEKSGVFDYKLPADYIGSSSSIIRIKDGFLMNMRSVNYTIQGNGGYIMRDPNNYVRTRNFLLTLDDNLVVTDSVELVDCSGRNKFSHHIMGLEDIRLFSETEFFCTCLEYNEKRTPQMCYCQYDRSTGYVTKIMPLSVTDEIKCEKNWLPLVIDGELCCIYQFNPLIIYTIDRQTGVMTEKINRKFETFNLSSFRGSTPPIPYKDGWLLIIHQVHYDSPRKYFHRFVWFNHDFTSMSFSKAFYFVSPNIEYTVSMIIQNDQLIIPFSYRDNSSQYVITSLASVDVMLKYQSA